MKQTPALILLATLCLLAGCNKLTNKNYARLQVGMKLEEVTQILGEPAQCEDVLLVKRCSWGDARHGIRVLFAADSLISSSAQGLD